MKYARKAKRKNAAAERKQKKKDAKHPEFKIGDETYRIGVDGITSFQDALDRYTETHSVEAEAEPEVIDAEPVEAEAPEEPIEFVEAEVVGIEN